MPVDRSPSSAKLSHHDVARVSRQLTNPDIRIALRPDFPPVIAVAMEPILPRLEAELAKCGQTLASVGEINLICPQKDPDAFPDHHNTAFPAFRKAVAKLRAEVSARDLGAQAPRIVRHDAIGELVHLDRSRGRPVMHSFTNRQVFTLNAARDARQPTAFTDGQATGRLHYFMLFDWHISTGTTLANLASFITHNGGHVLAAASLFQNRSLVPARKDQVLDNILPAGLKGRLAEDFAQSVTGEGVLTGIAYLLAKSAYLEGSPVKGNEALRDVEAVFNAHGHSLKAMTDSEAYRLLDALHIGSLTYSRVMAMKPGM